MANKTSFETGPAIILSYKNLSSDHSYALGEFIDNSIQSYLDNKDELHASRENYKPSIRIEIDKRTSVLTIKDNCSGISDSDAKRAFTVGMPNPNKKGIGTYGLGMKVSACWFSDKWRVNTKCLKESYAKTYNIDVNKIAEGDNDISPKIQENFEGKSFTHIIIENVFPNRMFDKRKLANIESYLNEQYMVFLKDKIVEIRYDGTPLAYKAPKIRIAPRFSDLIISEKKYKDDVKKLKWKTNFDLDLGDGYSAKVEAYLRDKGKSGPEKGFGIFWKNRNIVGNRVKPWAPKRENYVSKKDQGEMGIYLLPNNAINQRLEGNIFLSDNFKVSSTKDAVAWKENQQDKLVRLLKENLESCVLEDHPDEGKFDLRFEASNAQYTAGKKGRKSKPLPPPKDPDPKPIPPPKDPTPEPPSSPKPPKPEDTDGSFYYEYNGTKFRIKIDYVESMHDDIFERTLGPTEEDDGSYIVHLTINTGHRFMQSFLLSGDSDQQEKGVFMLLKALIIVESSLMTLKYDKIHHFNENLAELINHIEDLDK